MFKPIENIKVAKLRCKPSWSGTVSSNLVFHNSYAPRFTNSTNIIYKKVPLPLQGKDGTTIVENTDVMNLVDSVCSLKNPPQQIVKSIHSPYHLQMYDTLSRFCFHSQNLNFKGKRGAGSYSLQGPSGIGKTTTLINMTMIGEYLYPKVIPLYISSYLNIQSNADLRAHSIFHIVVSVLKELGHQVPTEEGKDLFPKILEFLDKSDKRVVLFVDEIDAMYTINHERNIDLARLANRNLSELATIGNDDSGLISAMLCSSSSHLSSLISSAARHYPELVLQFPLVKVSNINTTKFSTILINPPTNFEPIRKALNLKDMSLLRYYELLY